MRMCWPPACSLARVRDRCGGRAGAGVQAQLHCFLKGPRPADMCIQAVRCFRPQPRKRRGAPGAPRGDHLERPSKPAAAG